MVSMQLISGFGLAGFRSFGSPRQLVEPLGKINVFIGLNNSGKSNILSFVDKCASLETIGSRWKQGSDGFDFHIGESKIHIGVATPIEKIRSECGEALKQKSMSVECLERVLEVWPKTGDGESVVTWAVFLRGNSNVSLCSKLIKSMEEAGLSDSDWRTLSNTFDNTINPLRALIESVGRRFWRMAPKFDVRIIPAVRKLEATGKKTGDTSALLKSKVLTTELIAERLNWAQDPKASQREDRREYEHLRNFVRRLLNDPEADIRVPSTLDEFTVTLDGKYLPLKRLGTGIHQLVLLAAAATFFKDQVLLVEEPELHMHPTLQRKLVEYWATETENQYFIATHSAQLIDSPYTKVFHVWSQDGSSRVEYVNTRAARSTVCASLGYRASDIVQANAVVWVEGPSDRVYVRHWLKQRAGLTEGVEYSIMWYGGRLVSRVAALDLEQLGEKVVEMVALFELNRNSALVLDSDRKKAGARLSKTKLQLKRETAISSLWITGGREIENYVPFEKLKAAIRAVHPRAKGPKHPGKNHRYAQVITRGAGSKSAPDKTKIAQLLVDWSEEGQFDWDYGLYDLGKSIDRLASFIRRANDTQRYRQESSG